MSFKGRSAASIAQQKQYQKEKIKHISVNINKVTEPDIYQKLKEQPFKTTYIKRLIREDIARDKLESED